MSRDAGQVSTRQALLALLAATAALAAVVTLCSWLLPPVDEEAVLQAPAAADQEKPCPPQSLLPSQPIRVTSADLLDCPDTFDGRTVRFEGEVVSAVLRRGDRAWLQLNDDAYGVRLGPLPGHRVAVGGNAGMPVMVPVEVAERIRHVGGYHAYGDGVAVVGVFHRADPADGGGPAIQASEAEIVRSGRPVTHPLRLRQVVTAAVLAAVTLALTGVTLRARRA